VPESTASTAREQIHADSAFGAGPSQVVLDELLEKTLGPVVGIDTAGRISATVQIDVPSGDLDVAASWGASMFRDALRSAGVTSWRTLDALEIRVGPPGWASVRCRPALRPPRTS
jgi:hypothetical protein